MNNDYFEIVLVIGNGFDLNLGLKTSYLDFIESEQFIKLVRSKNNLAEYLYKESNLQNWIDIENELKDYSKSYSLNVAFFEEFKALSKSLCHYLSTINYNNLNEGSAAYSLIEKIKSYQTLIIDFNYTSTIKKILQEFKTSFYGDFSNIDHIKIHGSVRDEKIVFGVEDKAEISQQHIFLKKSTNKNFDTTNYNPFMEECETFIVFGHSLGETDHTYFDDFFLNACDSIQSRDQKNVHLFHYGEQGYNNLFSQLDSLTNRNISKFKQLNNVKM